MPKNRLSELDSGRSNEAFVDDESNDANNEETVQPKNSNTESKSGKIKNSNGGRTSIKINVEKNFDKDEIEQYLEQANELRSKLTWLRSLVSQLRAKQAELLDLPNTDERGVDGHRELDRFMGEIKAAAIEIKAKLKVIESLMDKDKETTATARIKSTQYSTLSRSYVQVMSEYNVAQAEYRDKCKARIQRQLEITGKATTNEELDTMLEEGNLSVFTAGLLVDSASARQSVKEIESRHVELLKLEQSLHELKDLFFDIANMVEIQGEMVDRVDVHVANASEFVSKARKETAMALVYQSKARRKKIFLVICLAVILVAVVLVLILEFGLGS